MKTYEWDIQNPNERAIVSAITALKNGGIVVFPTNHLYGLAVDAKQPAAIEKIFILKERPEYQPILVLISDRTMVPEWASYISPVAETCMDLFWPNLATLVFDALPRVNEILTAGTHKIGLREVDGGLKDLISQFGGAVTGTSANVSGQGGAHAISDIPDSILNRVDVILDAGTLTGGAGSTVLDTSTERVEVLRKGTLFDEKIAPYLADHT